MFLLLTDNGAKKVEWNSYTKHFLVGVKITDYSVLIDGTNLYDHPMNDEIKKYDEIRKAATRPGEDYATGCLLDYQYFKNHYQLIPVDLTKQKELDAYSKAVQQIEFYGILDNNS